jgi:2-polyprenyl-3-methyl-5-hydroxy-6-metoxy-1,4-benzoquinol methylase
LYDLVVMAEVIEHLPVSPSHVFSFLASLLRPGGYLLLQTPNACSLSKRLKMLIGRNPFELIRDDLHNPGHFREYTMRELAGYAGAAGFNVRRVTTANYFSGERLHSRVAAGISFALPAPLRNGITMWLVRE